MIQGTAEAITEVLIYGATAANWSTSPLMSTKASFDIATLPWIIANALQNLQAPQNIMIMNDFIDGATTYTAYQLSQARFSNQTQVAAIKSAEPVAHGVPSVQAKKIGNGEEVKAKHEQLHQDIKEHVALLQTITAGHQLILDEKDKVSDEDKRAHRALKAVQKEAEEKLKQQKKVVELARKNVAPH